MAKSSKLRVMISSRCNDPFPANATGRPLSDIGKELKADVETLEVFGKPIIEVWINEDSPPQGGTWDSWDVCMHAVKDCRDESTSRKGVQRFFEWVSQTGEEERVAQRALARARIVAAIAKEAEA